MKIGLIRHFKVDLSFPRRWLLSPDDVAEWFAQYETGELMYTQSDLGGVDWQVCYSSPLGRALITANYIYNGEVLQSDVLKELNALPLMRTRMRLPFIVWAILVRMKYASSNDVVIKFKNDIAEFVEDLLAKEQRDILIVSHGFVMLCIQDELRKRGFTGKRVKPSEHGRVFIFEN
jgi:broad specificity phosphatase PhoE